MHLTTLAAELGDKPAVILGGSGATLTFRELEESSNRIAQLFRARALQVGDHVAVLMRNQLEVFPVLMAAQRAGLLYTPVNWHLSAAEAEYIVADCGARMLISSAELEDIAAVAASSPALESRVTVGAVDGQEQLTEAVAGLPATPIADEIEGAPMFYSSGTTGRPKGILPELLREPYGTGGTLATTMETFFGFNRDTIYLCPGPMYHAAPLAWSVSTVRLGGTVILMERFDARAALELIQRYEITHGQYVPTMFVRMLKLDEAERAAFDLSSMKLAIHAAAPCPIDVKQKMIDWWGPILLEYYAGSEGNGICFIDSGTWTQRRGSVGVAVGCQVHIVGPDGTELGPHEVGTIYFSSEASDAGRGFRYHNDPDKTAAAYNDKNWSTLGDLGHVDEDGFVYLSDRRSDLIISGGVNIYPREIEDVIVLHPAVTDVAVIGLPDEEMGQRVHAVIQPADPDVDADALAAEIIGFVRDRIAHFKAPRSVSVEREFPRLPSGKVLRRVLVERLSATESAAT